MEFHIVLLVGLGVFRSIRHSRVLYIQAFENSFIARRVRRKELKTKYSNIFDVLLEQFHANCSFSFIFGNNFQAIGFIIGFTNKKEQEKMEKKLFHQPFYTSATFGSFWAKWFLLCCLYFLCLLGFCVFLTRSV